MDKTLALSLIRRACGHIRRKAPGFQPELGLILGSGLAKAVPPLEGARIIPYGKIPGFPRTTVPGHEGRLHLGRVGGRSVAVMQGRFHYYEGHSMGAAGLPVRVLRELGMESLLVTAAVGSMRPGIRPGDLTVVRDHVNLMGVNPLRGLHEAEFGTMFTDMTNAYDAGLRRALARACRARGARFREGVYLAVAGPSYETPAEIRAFRALGGDVVGMSVIPEILAARQAGAKAAALVWTSNMAAGLPGAVQDHGDVLALGARVSESLRGVLEEFLRGA